MEKVIRQGEKIPLLMRLFFEEEPSLVRVTWGYRGIPPAKGRKYVAIVQSPGFGTVPQGTFADPKKLAEYIRERKKDWADYIRKANWVHYRYSTKWGRSKLYFIYDPNIVGEEKYVGEWT